jgi:hypothetical protein
MRCVIDPYIPYSIHTLYITSLYLKHYTSYTHKALAAKNKGRRRCRGVARNLHSYSTLYTTALAPPRETAPPWHPLGRRPRPGPWHPLGGVRGAPPRETAPLGRRPRPGTPREMAPPP